MFKHTSSNIKLKTSSSFTLHVFAQKYVEKRTEEAKIVELKIASENPTAPTPKPMKKE